MSPHTKKTPLAESLHMSLESARQGHSRSLKTAHACLLLTTLTLLLACPLSTRAQGKRAHGFGARAVVVDERLAVLRDEAGLDARLLRRLSRGRMVSIISTKRTPDGLTFHRVAVTRRTRGWLQAEAIVSPARRGDDERFLRLIKASKDFDRITRASIFVEMFPRSALRPEVLMLLGDAAAEAAPKLSRDARRRLDEAEMKATGAPIYSYFMNYSGLDRLNRLGVKYTFDGATQQFRYDGAGWREILRRHPRSPLATAARQRLATVMAAGTP